MTQEEIRTALAEESDRVEWKQSSADIGEMLRAVGALANDLGDSRRTGYLVIGKADDGSVVGISRDSGKRDEEQQKLVNRLTSTKLLPTPSFHVEVIEEASAPLLIVAVEPYPVPPVVTVDGTAWIRRGTVTERAREADLYRLRERRPERQQPFDYRVIPAAGLEDLNLSNLRATYFAARDANFDPESFPDLEAWLSSN